MIYQNLLEVLPEENHLRVKYITVIYWLCTIFGGFFQLQYHFIYQYYDFAGILWPLYILTILNPIIGRIIKNYELTSISLLFTASFQAIILIYLAGAMLAPGIFWLTVIPISCGILLGRKGALFGATVVVLTTAFFVFAQYSWEVPNIVQKMDNFQQQRIINFIGFCIFSIWLVFYFLSHELDAQVEIRKHKSEIESLLHILIHDVASPLVVIETDIQRIKRKISDSDIQISVDRMDRNLKNVVELLKHIREMKALRDGKIGFELYPIDFGRVLKSTLDLVKLRADEKRVQIADQTKLDNCYIMGDETLLQNIVLLNLLVNAVKFSPAHETITLKGYADSKNIYFEIQDNGIGMPDYLLKNIFSLTYRTSRVGTSGEKGTGYGMLLVKQYIEKMMGSISIQSNEVGSGVGPSGTTVSLVFSKCEK